MDFEIIICIIRKKKLKILKIPFVIILIIMDIVSPFDLAIFLKYVVSEGVCGSNPFVKFIISKCFTDEERENHQNSQPLIKLMADTIVGIGNKYLNSLSSQPVPKERDIFLFEFITLYSIDSNNSIENS
ncbi:hypothetical protein ACTA71_002890 [Dictyostelium dimigraforme]